MCWGWLPWEPAGIKGCRSADWKNKGWKRSRMNGWGPWRARSASWMSASIAGNPSDDRSQRLWTVLQKNLVSKGPFALDALDGQHKILFADLPSIMMLNHGCEPPWFDIKYLFWEACHGCNTTSRVCVQSNVSALWLLVGIRDWPWSNNWGCGCLDFWRSWFLKVMPMRWSWQTDHLEYGFLWFPKKALRNPMVRMWASYYSYKWELCDPYKWNFTPVTQPFYVRLFMWVITCCQTIWNWVLCPPCISKGPIYPRDPITFWEWWLYIPIILWQGHWICRHIQLSNFCLFG